MPGTHDPVDALDHQTLVRVVPELLLIGQLIDRSGMPALLSEFGLDGMRDVAIEEWQAASPHYARRMKDALGITGDGVAEIFKSFQLDIGAPPEFMDFRYVVHDHDNGEFYLDHCGALMDVEPMGEQITKTMCHDIEDPTFPATAYATNPHARVEPIHRPPRNPEGRQPHCHWTVTIDESLPPVPLPDPARESAGARALATEFPPPDARRDVGEGTFADYSGPLLADLRFGDFTRATLVTVTREIYLQMHLLAVGFFQSVARRSDAGTADRLLIKQAVGIAGIAAERLASVLDVSPDLDGLARVLDVHPLCAPVEYTGYSRRLSSGGGVLEVRWGRHAPWWDDETWSRCLAAGDARIVAAAARAVDPRIVVEPVRDGDAVVLRCTIGDEAVDEAEEVALTRISTGSAFEFGPTRDYLPLTVVGSD